MLGQRKKYYKGLIHQNQIQGSSYDQLQIENIRNSRMQTNREDVQLGQYLWNSIYLPKKIKM